MFKKGHLDFLFDVLERDGIFDEIVIVFDELPVDGIVEGPAGGNGAELLDDLAEDKGESDDVVLVQKRVDRFF